MMSNLDLVKQLREETGVSLMECKKAIEEAGGDIETAKDLLRKKGQAMAAKRLGRDVGEGIITSYIHPNQKIGVLLDIRCESDFVARSDDFQNLAREICLQIAAMKPLFIQEEDVPEANIEKEKEIFMEQFATSDKPKEVIEKIIEGKINSYKKDVCLLSQEWVKDTSKTIESLVKEVIAKLGENIVIKGFTRYEI
ncbi:MAG: elongation factor Ts [Candidatus Nealsonbacteria bacterium]|nr:elongation factor Ts [Candidatus Nealsonbacteria bacterium]